MVKKSYKELEKNYKIVATIMLLALFLLVLVMYLWQDSFWDLKNQLSECQEQVEVNGTYTLKYRCYAKWGNYEWTGEKIFTSLEFYKKGLKWVDKYDCEVIE